MTESELQAIRGRNERRKASKAKASPTQDWAKDRVQLTVVSRGGQVVILYDDGDFCAEVHDHLGFGCSALDYAEFFAGCHNDPVEDDVAALLAEVDRLRADVERLEDERSRWCKE